MEFVANWGEAAARHSWLRHAGGKYSINTRAFTDDMLPKCVATAEEGGILLSGRLGAQIWSEMRWIDELVATQELRFEDVLQPGTLAELETGARNGRDAEEWTNLGAPQQLGCTIVLLLLLLYLTSNSPWSGRPPDDYVNTFSGCCWSRLLVDLLSGIAGVFSAARRTCRRLIRFQSCSADATVGVRMKEYRFPWSGKSFYSLTGFWATEHEPVW